MIEDAGRIDGDADRDGDVDGADFLAWQQNLGAAPAANPVPEPTALLITALALAATLIAKRPIVLAATRRYSAAERGPRQRPIFQKLFVENGRASR
jgi:hypothetical protein